MELKKPVQFVADGHQRWLAAREGKFRATVHENKPIGFLGKIRRWVKTEAAALRGRKTDGKSSPKILW